MFVTVPLLDLQAQYAPLRQALLDAVTRVCDSQRFIGGPEVEGLERELCDTLGYPHAIGLSSGTDAVLAALMALDIGPGDEVITPTYSFFATAGCVVRVGAKPVLVDIEPGTFNIDAHAAIAAITPRTKAIIPVHLFGQSAEMAPIVEAAQPARHRGDRGRGAGDRLRRITAGRSAPSARSAASRSSRARISARSATPASSPRPTRRWRRSCG